MPPASFVVSVLPAAIEAGPAPSELTLARLTPGALRSPLLFYTHVISEQLCLGLQNNPSKYSSPWDWEMPRGFRNRLYISAYAYKGSSRAVEKPGFSGNSGNFASRPTVMREIVPSSGSLSGPLPFATMERAVLKLSSSSSLSLSYLRIRIHREPLCPSCPLKVRVCNMHRLLGLALPLLTFGSERFTYAWEMSRSVTSDNSRLGLVSPPPDTRVGIDRRTTSLNPIFEYLNLIK